MDDISGLAIPGLGPFLLTLRLAGVTVLVLLGIGTPLAWWLALTRSRLKVPVEAVVALPLVLPPTVIGFYLLIVLVPQGFIGGPWQSLTGDALTFIPINIAKNGAATEPDPLRDHGRW